MQKVNGDDCPTHHIKHYQELQCKPIIQDGQNCPSSYDCQIPTDPEKCFVNGISYERGESIPNNEIGFCRDECYCDK